MRLHERVDRRIESACATCLVHGMARRSCSKSLFGERALRLVGELFGRMPLRIALGVDALVRRFFAARKIPVGYQCADASSFHPSEIAGDTTSRPA